MHKQKFLLALAAAFLFLAAGCSQDDADGDPDSGTDSGVGPGTWDGITLSEVSAPDEYTLLVTLNSDIRVDDLENLDHYGVASSYGDLNLEDVQYDSDTGDLTFTTAKQKLGVTYTLNLIGESGPEVSEDFLSADEAVFWLDDISIPGYNQYQKAAVRTAVGDHVVVYVDPETSYDNPEQIVEWFDNDIYPVETQLFSEGSDIDGNGRTVLLFMDMGNACGAYCSYLHFCDEEYAMNRWELHSNEMELVFVNTNSSIVHSYKDNLAHEFQHILYYAEHDDKGWVYHNEGLSECAVRAVTGGNEYFINGYFLDYYGEIGRGLTLVNWDYADSSIEHYATAFLFWSYLAAQLDGVETYGDIFDMESGQPNEVNAFIQNELGISMPQAHFNQLLANWVQNETGVYGYNGFLELGGSTPPTAPSWLTSVDLEPFMGTFFRVSQDSVSYPGTQGPNIRYAGIDSAGNVDLTEPFTVGAGGGLLVHNSAFDVSYPPPSEHSGPDISSSKKSETAQTTLSEPIGAFDGVYPPTWFNPPPFDPENPEPYLNWKLRNIDRTAAIEQRNNENTR